MSTEYDDDGRMVYYSRRPPQPWAEDADPDECSRPRRRSRNRSLVIILIDVALILLIYAVITTFIRADSFRGEIAGVEVSLNVHPGDVSDTWQLRFTRRETPNGIPRAEIVEVRFSDGDRFNPEPVLDVLPDVVGAQRLIEISAPASTRVARTRIAVGDRTLHLHRRTR